VARCFQDSKAKVADDEGLAVLHPQIHEGRGAALVHHDRESQLLAQLARGREVIGVGVRVEEVAHAESLLRRQRHIAVGRVQLGIDDDRTARLLAANQIRKAAPPPHLFEDHGASSPIATHPASAATALLVPCRCGSVPAS
jgi:hypothetical protein